MVLVSALRALAITVRPISARSAVALRMATPSYVAAPRYMATAAASSKPAAKKASSATATKKKSKTTTTKKPAAKKKAAAPKKPKKKAAPKPKKKALKSWEEIDPATGKLKPLPSASKPTRRTPFIAFVSERFPVVKSDSSFQVPSKEGSGTRLDTTKVVRALADEWKSLSDSGKDKYTRLVEAERPAYEAALEKWQASLTPEDIARQNRYTAAQRKKGKRGTARLRDPRKPTRPPTAFFEFLKEQREAGALGGANATVVDMAKAAGEKWKALSKEQKEPYEMKAQGAKDQYLADMQRYKQQLSGASA